MTLTHRKRATMEKRTDIAISTSVDRRAMEEDTISRPKYLNSIKLGIIVVLITLSVIVGVVLIDVRVEKNSADTMTLDGKTSTPPNPSQTPRPRSPSSYTPRVSSIGSFQLLETVPHDRTAFTQGFCIFNNSLFEGTGNYGQSSVRQVDLLTGNVLKNVSIDADLFGEGIAHYPTKYGTRIVQITYKEQTGIIWDLNLTRLQTFSYSTTTSEGWGVTYANGHGLMVSDGSEWIMVWDPTGLSQPGAVVQDTRRFQVKLHYKGEDQPRTLSRINELEWDTHSNTLLANVWIQDVLVRVDVATGYVTNIYDIQSLWPNRPSSVDVFNGVAITDEKDVVWVTGKWWPSMYKIRLIP